jgi:predicted dehydrogenase
VSINVGIIGLGKMGKLHLRVSRYMDDARVVAVADPSPRVTAAQKEGVRKIATTITRLASSSDVDAVIIPCQPCT